jgi:ribonuclease HI
MAREISIREEYLADSDEATLQAVLKALSREFLLIPLDDYRIEVNEMDYEAVSQALNDFKRDYELNSKP